MNEKAFTPGPWRAVDQRTHHSIHGAGDASLCDVLSYSFGNGPDRDRRAANAALIAAAPALYAALSELLNASIKDYGLSDDDGDDEPVAMSSSGGVAVTFGMLRRARTALSAAKKQD